MPLKSLDFRRVRRRPVRSKQPDATDAQIGHINALTTTGRTNWFALLAYLAFVLVTALGVQDADFFVDSRETELPLIGVSIPTFSFFIFAPVIGAALYVYLHLGIRKSTEALAAPPPVIDGTPLETRIAPWLVNDLVLRLRGGGAAAPRPLDTLASLVTVALVWLAGPYVLAFLWWRSWPAHSVGLTLLCAACTMLSLWAGCQSWAKMERDVGVERPFARLSSGAMDVLAIWLTAAVAALSLVPTQGIVIPGDQSRLLEWAQGRLFVARPDLTRARLSILPPEHADLDTARHRYRTEWCQRNGLPPAICGGNPAATEEAIEVLWQARGRWCAEAGFSDCRAHFSNLNDDFDNREWPTFRAAMIAALEKPDLSGKDLRTARIVAADLVGIDASAANLEGADLRFSRLERADLSEARLEGADLRSARLEGALFVHARLEGADLSGARLEGAVLLDARLEGAVLLDARLEGATLVGARLEGADLRRAGLEGANLRRAGLEGANLGWARLEGADLRWARLKGAILVGARLEGADLREAQLEGAILVGAGLEGADLREAQLEGADLSFSKLTGTADQLMLLSSTNLSAVINDGGALRFVDLRPTTSNPASDFRNSFGDASAILPEDVEPPCQWASEPLSDANFHARWRGWLEAAPEAPPWPVIAPEEWREVEPVPPPTGCTWQK